MANPEFEAARARKTEAQATLAELELAKAQSELVAVEDVIAAWADTVATVKNRLLAIPTKTAPLICVESEPTICHKIVESEIYEALEELANYEPKTTATRANAQSSQSGNAGDETTAAPKRRKVGRQKPSARILDQ